MRIRNPVSLTSTEGSLLFDLDFIHPMVLKKCEKVFIISTLKSKVLIIVVFHKLFKVLKTKKIKILMNNDYLIINVKYFILLPIRKLQK